MTGLELSDILGQRIPAALAEDAARGFAELRRDTASRTLERASAGKLIETFVQILQFLECGKWDPQPNVDQYLRGVDSRLSSLDDGLRVCGARVARAMYSLRSKRNIVHKGDVDPNVYDLAFLLHGAQWIMAELVRVVSQVSMTDAGAVVARIQAPVGTLVQDFGERRIVLAKTSVKDEMLVLLQSFYPSLRTTAQIVESLDRRVPKTVTNRIADLWAGKLIEGSATEGYQLTNTGLAAAGQVLARVADTT